MGMPYKLGIYYVNGLFMRRIAITGVDETHDIGAASITGVDEAYNIGAASVDEAIIIWVILSI